MSLEFTEDGEHLSLTRLKQELWRENICKKYIRKNHVPTYPRPELHVSHVSHCTDLQGLQGIWADKGFRDPYGTPQELKVAWFSLTVSPHELQDAENRDMTLVQPGGHEQQLRPGGWDDWDDWDDDALVGPLPPRGKLWNFATSPAFSSSSRYGSYRFIFSLQDVLDKYSQQFCGGQRPVLRMYRTVLYKQEVMYAVLVHSPINNRRFSQRFPLLEESSICNYSSYPQPHLIWSPEAMSETHWIGLGENNDGTLFTQWYGPRAQYYVWDHVALALHVGHQVLRFTDWELSGSLRFCERAPGPTLRPGLQYEDFSQAQAETQALWPQCRLQRFNQSVFHIHK